MRPKYLHQAQFVSLKDRHETPSKLLKYLQQTIFPLQKLPGPLKSSQNCEISPNLVTLSAISTGVNLEVVWAEFSTLSKAVWTDNTINPLNTNGHF
jgi:hypothetical protein